MSKIFKFLYFLFRYPFHYKIELLRLYLGRSARKENVLNIHPYAEFIKVNHKLHEFKNNKNFDFKILDGEILLKNNYNGKPLQVIAKNKSSDLFVYDQIFVEQEYESLVSLLINNKVHPHLVVDWGANIGYALLYLHLYFNPIKFYCMAPNKDNAMHIRNNFILNGITNFKVYPLANGDQASSGNRIQPGHGTAPFSLRELVLENALEYIDVLRVEDYKNIEILLGTASNRNILFEKVKFIALEVPERLYASEVIDLFDNNGFETHQTTEGLVIGVNRALVLQEQL